MGKIMHKYGWIKDSIDPLDHLLFPFKYRIPVALPPLIDLRDRCSPIEDQGNLGSCTANALVGVLEFLEIKAGSPFVDLSRLLLYYDERDVEGTVSQDSGAQLRTGIQVLKTLGVCRESLWPYDIGQFAVQPSSVCYAEASKHTISAYQKLESVDEMRACLAAGFPFAGGFTVWPSMETDAVAKSGIIPTPGFFESRFGKPLGGHAIMFCGYDDAARRFIIRNSWGVGWGNGGYGTIPYDYPVDDCWVVQKTENDLYSFKQNIEEMAA
jgi:C1A family cysteine protease